MLKRGRTFGEFDFFTELALKYSQMLNDKHTEPA